MRHNNGISGRASRAADAEGYAARSVSVNEHHEANRRHWDNAAAAWRDMRDRDGLWKRCAVDPKLAF
jgi:hypothetical protein